MTTTLQQSLAIQAVKKADEDYRALRKVVEATVRAEIAKRTQEASDNVARATWAARQAGVGPTRLAREAFGHEGRATVYRYLARGGELAGDTPTVVSAADEVVSEFEWVQPGVVRVQPAAATLAPLLAMLDIDGAGRAFWADFEVVDGRVLPLTEAWTAEEGRNPVVALVIGEDPTYRERVASWAAGKVAA
ncbi:hypothetical protein [Microbacterium sp. T32]|uniref:hypothetical protein n=1 Tax=Microbacterium sp. T32 TaxID=1776083 RepID=UPI0007AB410A|nr:hypothetical protein [Microbacterium sp. T32]KZE41405.1 hypothetical protein AVW09_02115 [Microbacterium sp. T32]